MSAPGESRLQHSASCNGRQRHVEPALDPVRAREGWAASAMSSLTVAELDRTYQVTDTGPDAPTVAASRTASPDAATGRRAERLARVWGSKVSQLTSEDVLIALLQGWGLALLVPQVLDLLARDSLASGGWFRGDYVRALMQLPATFWSRHPRLYARYRGALRESALRRRALPADERAEFWTDFDSILR